MVNRRSFFNLILVLCVFCFSQAMTLRCHAGMHRLSKIQNGIFHLRPKLLESDTDKTDRYIDDEQAYQIAALSRVDPYTPADDDYTYTLVDSLLLDTDLAIDYGNDACCMICAGARHRYLSRNDTSPALFFEKKAPVVFATHINITEPFTCENVDAYSTTIIDNRVYGESHYTVSSTWPFSINFEENESNTGKMEGGYVHAIHSCYTVWQHSHPPLAGTCFNFTPNAACGQSCREYRDMTH